MRGWIADLAEGQHLVGAVLGDVGELLPGAALEAAEALDREAPVGRARQRQDRLGHLDVELQRGAAGGAGAAVDRAVSPAQLLDLLRGLPAHALGADPGLLDQRPEGGHALVHGGEVALDGDQLRHRLAGDRLALALAPVADHAAGLRQLVGGVVQQRRRDDVGAGAQVLLGEAAELRRDAVERVPVGLRLPGRRDRRVERVDEGVQVGAGDVVLLVPGGRGQDDVGVDRRAVHAEVDRREQVELALGGLLAPLDLLGPPLGRRLGGAHGGVRHTEDVAQEVLVALAGGAHQVGAPQGQHPREVGGVVGVLAGELQPSLLQLRDHVVGGLSPRGAGLVAELERVAVEGGVGGKPTEAGGESVAVGDVPAGERAVAGRRGELLGAVALVAPLVAHQVPEGGGGLLARRALPVESEGDGAPAGDRAHLLLADVVGPAAAVDALASAEQAQREHRPVGLVGVVPVVGPGAHHDHRAAAGPLGVGCELPGDPRADSGVHTGQRLLPGGGVRHRLVVVARRPLPRHPLPSDAVLRQGQVEHRRHELAADAAGRYAAADRGASLGLAAVEARHRHLDGLVLGFEQAEPGIELAQIQVPVPLALLAPAVADRAVGHHRLPAVGIEDDGLPLGVLLLGSKVRGAQERVRHHRPVLALAQRHQVGHVREAARVVGEARGQAVHVELLQDHVPHGHRQRAVCPGARRQPLIGELGVAGVVGRDDDDLLAPVSRLRHEVGIRGAGLRDVGAPQHQVRRVPPVRGLGHVGLVPPDLGGRGRQVGVPVVEAEADPADQRQEPGPGRVRDHRHRRDRREADDPVGAVAAGGVHVGRSDQLGDLVPGRPHEPALAALGLVGAGPLGVLDDRGPRLDRIPGALLRLAVHLQQHAAHVGELGPQRRVHVPGERGAAGTAARLVVRDVGAVRGVVGLLGLPGDEPVLDVDLPRARARAVDAVGRPHHAVVLPASAVGALPFTGVGRRLAPPLLGAVARAEELPRPEQAPAAHRGRPVGR